MCWLYRSSGIAILSSASDWTPAVRPEREPARSHWERFASVRQRERGGPVRGSVSETPATGRSPHRVLPLVGCDACESRPQHGARRSRSLDGRAPSVNPGTRVGAVRRKRPGSRPGHGSRGRIRGRWSRARRSGRDGVRDTALLLARTRCARRGPRQYATRFGQRGPTPHPASDERGAAGPRPRAHVSGQGISALMRVPRPGALSTSR